MKRIAVLLLSMCFICGCATSTAINRISIGMTKTEVIKTLGTPVSTSAEGNTEFLNYKFSETDDEAFCGITTPYAVRLIDGKVASYGRHGDFGTTEKTAQTIKIIKE